MSQVLATRVARELGLKTEKTEIRRFPDGEKYLRVLDSVKDEDLVVIHSFHHIPDELLFEYLLLVDTLKDLGARRVISFIPYFAYARQDRRFNSGEAVSLKTVCKLVESVGTDEIYTIDMHQHRIKFSEVFKIPSHDLTAMLLLAEHVRRIGILKNPIVIGPDVEAGQWAKMVAQRLRTDYVVFEKERLGSETVKIRPGEASAEDRDVLIVEDIISTGETIIETLKTVFSQGARAAVVACTHPILVDDALARIYEAGAHRVIATDTVPSQISCVSVAPLIADELRKIGLVRTQLT